MRLREIATPLTIGSFLITSATGVLIFFHLERNLVTFAHIWLSWAMIVGALLHIFVNKKAFLVYLKKPWAVSIIVICTALFLLSTVPIPFGKKKEKAPNTVQLIRKALSDEPISVIASITKEHPRNILARLKQTGIPAKHEQQTIEEIAIQAGMTNWQIIQVIFTHSRETN